VLSRLGHVLETPEELVHVIAAPAEELLEGDL
jgi:hypothetical protein